MELILSIWSLIWLIVSNSYILAFIITGIIMRVAYEAVGFWFGYTGGVILYAVISFLLFISL